MRTFVIVPTSPHSSVVSPGTDVLPHAGTFTDSCTTGAGLAMDDERWSAADEFTRTGMKRLEEVLSAFERDTSPSHSCDIAAEEPSGTAEPASIGGPGQLQAAESDVARSVTLQAVTPERCAEVGGI